MENRTLPEHERQSGSLRDFLTVLFKHKTKIATVFAGVVLCTVIITLRRPPVYEAKSSMLVKIGREYLTHPEVGDTKSLMSLSKEEVINSEIQILSSKELMAKVVDTLGVKVLYPDMASNDSSRLDPRDRAVEVFSRNISAEGVKKSSVIQLTFRHGDPLVAARAVNLMTEFFKEKHLKVFSDPQSSFLKQQLDVYAQKLKESERSLEAFKQRNRVYSIDEQRTLLLQQRMGLDTALKTAESRVFELEKRISVLQGQKKSLLADGSHYAPREEPDSAVSDAKTRLLALQLEEQDLLKKYKEGNRLVVNVRKGIRLVEDFLAEEERNAQERMKTGNVYYQEVEMQLIRGKADLSSLKAQTSALKAQMQRVDREIHDLELRYNEMQELTREVETGRKNYQTYVDRAEEARISENMNSLKMANISVIQGATVPAEPVSPQKALHILIGIICGMVGGIVAAFASEYAAQHFSHPEHVERRLGVPVLATIPNREE